jgi:hypothetical protein
MEDADLLEQLRTKLTVSVPVAGRAFGLSRSPAYEAARKGYIGGVEVIEIGRRKVVPTAPIRRKLGLEAA